MDSSPIPKPLKVLIPAYKDYDPTEIALAYDILTKSSTPTTVTFTTIDGQPAQTDAIVLRGPILGGLGGAPTPAALAAYQNMTTTSEYNHPLKWSETDFDEYDGLVLAGGHAKGVKEYLESDILQKKVASYFVKTKEGYEGNDRRIVSAVCHGPVLLSRSIDEETGKSVLYGRKTSCLPRHLESFAAFMTPNLGDYYRTYPEYVQDEVARATGDPALVQVGSTGILTGPLSMRKPIVVQDGTYVSARWPGDVAALTEAFIETLKKVKDEH